MAQINGWMSIPDAFANTVFARGGWDGVVLDAQHGLFDEAAIVRTLQVLSAPKPRRLVRVPWNEPGLLGKVLDAGADGVIVPMVNSVEAARRVAEACWYPPRGSRSFGPILAALRSGNLPYEEAAQTIEVLAMIETREALATVGEIAAVDGITGLFVGPNDLALSFGLRPGTDRDEPELIAAFRTIIDAAARSGRTAGIFCNSPGYARRMVELGFSMVSVISDAAVLGKGAAAAYAAVADRHDPDH